MRFTARCRVKSVLAVTAMVAGICMAFASETTASLARRPAPDPTATPISKRTGLLIGVVILPPDSSDKGEIKDLENLRDAIHAYSPAYGAWVNGSNDCQLEKCLLESAGIVIRARKDPKGVYSFTSVDLDHGTMIGTLTGETADALAKLGSQDLVRLLGTPSFDGKSLTVSNGFQQYLQLVPAPESDSIPEYSTIMAELLARRGITAVRSAFTSAQLGSAPSSTICSQGERYLVYSIRVTSDTKVFTGFTRIGANTNAYIADCVTHTTIPFAGEDVTAMPTTNNSLAKWAAILSLFIPKFHLMAFTTGAATISGFVDVPASSAVAVQNNTAVLALQRAVDRMCDELNLIDRYHSGDMSPPTPAPSPPVTIAQLSGFTPFSLPTASPPPTPGPTPTPAPEKSGSHFFKAKVKTTGGTTPENKPATTAASGTASASTNPLDLTSFVGPWPPPLKCNAPTDANKLHVPALPPYPSQPLFDRGKVPEQP